MRPSLSSRIRAAWSVLLLLSSGAAHSQEIAPHAPQMRIQNKRALLTEKDSRSVLLGHNLHPTSYTLKKRETTAGFYALAYGITDYLMIGTSPWIVVNYNMPMVDLKIAAAPGGWIHQVSLEQMYFKTQKFGWDKYKQESWTTRLTASHRFSTDYTLHVSSSFQYFVDETAPYSIRLLPGNGDRYALSLGALNEIHFNERFGMFAELGALGLNYAGAPYAHSGLSAFYREEWGHVQLGLSHSMPLKRGVSTLRAEGLVYSGELRRYSQLHPEVQVQFML